MHLPGHFKIKFVQGVRMIWVRSSAGLAATIGRAFDWMDRVATLNLLDAMIESNGAVGD